jgi:hypothetical protein
MATSHEPLAAGYDVDDNASRFSNYFHVLRELVHLSCGWLPLEPRLEVKYALGRPSARRRARAEQDQAAPVRAAHAERLPRRAVAGAGRAARSRQRRHDSAEYVELAYGELKPALAEAMRIHLATLDPVVDEPSLRLLTQLLHRQERHVVELPPAQSHPLAFEDLGALPIRLREVRELKIMAPLVEPARDDYVQVTPEGDTYLTDDLYVNGDENHVPTDPEEQKHFFHGLMDAELCAAELMARNSH